LHIAILLSYNSHVFVVLAGGLSSSQASAYSQEHSGFTSMGASTRLVVGFGQSPPFLHAKRTKGRLLSGILAWGVCGSGLPLDTGIDTEFREST